MSTVRPFLRPECRRVARLVQAYLDGELDRHQAQAVASHLERCERCGPDAELLDAVRHALVGLAVPINPIVLVRLETFLHDLAHDDRHPMDTTGGE